MRVTISFSFDSDFDKPESEEHGDDDIDEIAYRKWKEENDE